MLRKLKSQSKCGEKISTFYFIFSKIWQFFSGKNENIATEYFVFYFHINLAHTHTHKEAEEEVLRLTWLIEKMTWKRLLCFNFQLPLHVEMTCVHLNFFIDSEEHWSWKISTEVRSLKSEPPCDDLEYISFQIIWLHLIGSELELQLETIMWHTRLLRKLCIYFAIGYVVVLIFSIIYLISPKCVFAEKF